ncbi:MAG: SH3 domain-containing protein [Synergistaceae bacterium]|nr:SH3 domain-containing protein [Synergistaceae bacterium]
MSWIILAITLGASITSMIHGVFMLFGSLSVTGGAMFGIPSTLLASLPVISAIFALIGGIMAFNQTKWGALFLFIAMGLCVPSRDTWLYGGLYFFAGLFCFFLKPKQSEQEALYGEYEDDYPEEQDFYYAQDISAEPVQVQSQEPLSPPVVGADIPTPILSPSPDASDPLQAVAEPPRVRRRMSKSCPECGAIVSRDNRFCPTCGAKLFVAPDELELNLTQGENELQEASEQLLMPSADELQEFQDAMQGAEIVAEAENYGADASDELTPPTTEENHRVLVSPRREDDEYDMRETRRKTRAMTADTAAAASYQEFSKYTKRAKKRKRSTGRKVLSMMLLVAAVGGALYFLLGLRKLPPGDLPPIAQNNLTPVNDELPVSNIPPVEDNTPSRTDTAEPVSLVVAENVLPDFNPDRLPKNGIITGSSVNVRADHNTSSARVTRLKVNSRVDIIGTHNVTSGQYAGIWYNIRTGGNEGWVYGKYVQPLGSGLPSGYSSALLKTFGSSRSQLVESLGNPTRSTGSSAEWPGLTATLKGEDITRIRLTNDSRELQNGLKTGMSQTALLQIMGYPSSQNGRTMNYNEGTKTGLSIQLDRNSAISSITVNEI